MTAAASGVVADPAAEAAPLWRHVAFRGTLAAALLLSVVFTFGWGSISGVLFDLEFALAGLVPLETVAGSAWFLLPFVGFGAGLLASLSPCVLPLVPLNLAYIGAAEASGARAVALSARFVLGAALMLSVLGLAGDLAGWLLIEQRGPMLLGTGLLMVVFGLVSLDLVSLPGAGRRLGAGCRLGPVGAGAVFSLVTTPCASPLLAAVLAAAGAQSIPGLSAVAMLCFALGYTLLVFAAGVFGGGLVSRLKGRAFAAPRAAAAALLLAAGVGFAFAGVAWF